VAGARVGRSLADMADTVLQTVPLGFQWPTVDPFLFCVHHDDAYPPGNEVAGPAVSLEGRELGQDFEGLDGWRMYHGKDVPGFPNHPHRGFETVTYVRKGLIDHSDSLGAAARFGQGDVQWLEAEQPNPLELFQIWLNLPAEDKLVEPHFSMLWDGDIPRLRSEGVEITVIAGELAGLTPPPPPPHSWAGRPDADVAIWHLRFEPGARWTMPRAEGGDTIRTLYLFDGGGLVVDGTDVPAGTGAVVRPDVDIDLESPAGTDVLVLQGRPIGEPVARYGPFVMNEEHEIEQAFADYRDTQFGGWPWPSEEPVHAHATGRFAKRPDGVVEEPAPG